MATNKSPKAATQPAKPQKAEKAAPAVKKQPTKPSAAKEDPDFIREEVRRIAVDLTEKEIAQKGRDLASVMQQIANEEINTGLIKADIKSRMSALESQQSNLTLLITNAKELRDVRCKIVIDKRRRKMVNIIRLDTGEVIGSREITPDEAQRSLPLDEAKKKAPETAKAGTATTGEKDQAESGKADETAGPDQQPKPEAA